MPGSARLPTAARFAEAASRPKHRCAACVTVCWAGRWPETRRLPVPKPSAHQVLAAAPARLGHGGAGSSRGCRVASHAFEGQGWHGCRDFCVDGCCDSLHDGFCDGHEDCCGNAGDGRGDGRQECSAEGYGKGAVGSLEDFLASRREEEEVPSDVPVQDVLPMSCRGLQLLEELRRLRMPRGPLSLAVLKVWSLWELRGLPASARLPQGKVPQVARLHRPTAEELFQCVLCNRPALITGALTTEAFPPLADFADFHYLRARCGERRVLVKADFFRDRAGRQVFVSDPTMELSLADFLDRIEEAEALGGSPACYMGKVRLDDQVPEMVADIALAQTSPMDLYGDCFGENLEGVHTYFGCGRNSTSVHCDPGENLLVVICGTKRFDIFPPSDVDVLYPCRPPSFLCSSVPPLTLPGAMPQDLAERCPLYCHAQPITVNLESGDIFYLPAFWWHGVSGGEDRNMILNWWCELHPSKKEFMGDTQGARGVLQDISKELQALQSDALR